MSDIKISDILIKQSGTVGWFEEGETYKCIKIEGGKPLVRTGMPVPKLAVLRKVADS